MYFSPALNHIQKGIFMENQPFYGVPVYNQAFSPEYLKALEEEQAQKQLRRRSNVSAIPMLILMVAMSAWSYVYFAVMTVLGYTQEFAVAFISDSGIMQVAQIIISSSLFIIPFTITAKIAHLRISDLIPFNKCQKGTAFPFLLIGVGFCAFANMATSIAGGIFESFGFSYEVGYGKDPEGIFGILLSVISTAIVPALVEEYACRGIIFGMFEKWGAGFALMVSSIFFGAMHGNFEQIPFAFLVGLALGLIRIKTGSIWVCMVVHGINNFISVLISYIQGFMRTDVLNIIYLFYLTIAMLSVVIGAYLLRHRDAEFFKFEKNPSVMTVRKKAVTVFTSPVTIIFLVICIAESIGVFFL